MVQLTEIVAFVSAQPGRTASFTHICKYLCKEDFINRLGQVAAGLVRLKNIGQIEEIKKAQYYAPFVPTKRTVYGEPELNAFRNWISNGVVCEKCYSFIPIPQEVFSSITLSDHGYYGRTGNAFRIDTDHVYECTGPDCKNLFSYTETNLNDYYYHLLS